MIRPAAVASLLILCVAAPAAGQTWRTSGVARQLTGQTELHVQLEYAAGRFELSPATGSLLYRLESEYDARHFELDSRYTESDRAGRLRVELDAGESFDLKQLTRQNLGAGSLSLSVSPEIPLDLDLELGAAEADLNLGGLMLRRVRLETGASDTRVRFDRPNPGVADRCIFRAGAASFRVEGLGNARCRRLTFNSGVGALELDFAGEWREGETEAEIDIGVGSVGIDVPHEVGIRIERHAFLLKINAPELQKRDRFWVSENWETAERRLSILVRGALGTVRVTRR